MTMEEIGAPPELAAWEKWVLFGQENRLCPKPIGNLARVCAWPGTLDLNLTETGGTFEGTWDIFRPMAVNLPGGPRTWPEKVTDSLADGPAIPATVLSQNRPQVFLQPGRHVLKGQWSWSQIPETLTIPLGPIYKVTVDGREKLFGHQEIDYSSQTVRFWLKDPAAPSVPLVTPPDSPGPAEPNQVKVVIDRLLIDEQPMQITTRVRLTVTGQNREIFLDNILLSKTLPTSLVTPLSARLSGRGLRIQARPGAFELIINARLEGPEEEVGPVGEYGSENWAVHLIPALRQVNISGAPQIDASQVDIPWKNYPIYALEPGNWLKFETVRRGDPEPGPDQLTLERQCWLDYTGRGLSCNDRLTGLMRRNWQLSVDPPFTLGQASVNGQDQVLTWQINSQGEKAPGFQLRHGSLAVRADLRLENFQSVIPASGWDHDLSSTAQRLNLPPGYRLFQVKGARAVSPQGQPITWQDRWNTLDMFIVLAIFLATYRIKGRRLALVALVTMILAYHEFLAPRLVFLHILGALALLKVLPPQGGARGIVRFWYGTACLFLLLTSVFFLIHQVRITMYPQLEEVNAYRGGKFGYPMSEAFYSKSWFLPSFGAAQNTELYEPSYDETTDYQEMAVVSQDSLAESPRFQPSSAAAPPPPAAPSQKAGLKARARQEIVLQSSLAKPNPEAKTQNSLARPDWEWQTVALDFNGQVAKNQEVRLCLITPLMRKILGFLQIVTMITLVLGIFGLNPKSRPHKSPEPKPKPTNSGPVKSAVILALLAASVVFSNFKAEAQSDNTQSFPSPALLNELKTRLLEPSPEEAIVPGFPELAVEISDETIKLTFRVEAAAAIAVPMPILDSNSFRAGRLATSEGRNLPLLVRSNEEIYVLLPPGLSVFTYEGRLKSASSLIISLINNFKPQKVTVKGEGWEVSGLDEENYPLSSAVMLTKVRPSREKAEAEEPPKENESAAGEEPPSDKAEGSAESGAGNETQSDNQAITPFYIVQRTISLGLEWKVLNQVTLNSEINYPVSLSLPLLPGETPIGDQIVRDGAVILNFSPNRQQITFESDLKQTEAPLVLEAKPGPYSESWILDPSNLWRVEATGLNPIYNVTQSGYWHPQWCPWPNEKLTVKITKPEPVPGTYLVSDEASLNLILGAQNRRAELKFTVRSSLGGHHTFRLPPGSEIQSLSVDNQTLPISSADIEKGPEVTLPLTPGTHKVACVWLTSEPLTSLAATPELDLGFQTANINLTVSVPEDRWVLLAGGPTQGPAVLFWSIAGAVLIISAFLGHLKLTPLKTFSWFILILGLAQLSIYSAFFVAGWLLVLGIRGKSNTIKRLSVFNLAQIGLVFWTAIALYLIYEGLKHGLLEAPVMNVQGNGSWEHQLRWFSDRTEGPWPGAWILTLSTKIYSYLMLVWAVWLAVSIIRWLIWGWKCFSSTTLWKKGPPRPPQPNTLPPMLKKPGQNQTDQETPLPDQEIPETTPEPQAG
jgi:hypothetical protein